MDAGSVEGAANTIEDRCRELVSALGIGRAEDVSNIEPLTGGVASDIARFHIKDRDYCVKFARSKLKVAEDWRAPIHRGVAEYAWLEFVATVAPSASVKLFGQSEEVHGFAMEFLGGMDVWLWKEELLAGRVPAGAAAKVGDLLGCIHTASTETGFDTLPFQNRDDFSALRIEPYLSFTAARHPDIARQFEDMAEALYEESEVLVHGDVSPKNIIFRNNHPVILDAECATMGSAAFDPAFCLNHLILKSLHLPGHADALLDEARAFWTAYARHCSLPNLETRIARLVPALMLARVDGKSPVEYLSEENRDIVRRIVKPLVLAPSTTLECLLVRIAAHRETPGT